ncbi:hypothetical protein BH20CHL8_BH20CHL8_08060 [soil metagenome]
MSRWIAPAAAVALLAAVSVGVIVAAQAPEPTSAERADAIARELRCPDCQGLSVADSPTQSAAEIRRQIGEQLAAGASPDEVRAHFVARYGEWILLAPSSPVVWVVPLAVVAVAGAGLIVWLARRRPPAPTAARPDEVLRHRLHDEAEALDA